MSKRLSRTLETTKFAGASIIAVAAKPGGPEAPEAEATIGVESLVEVCTFDCDCLSVCLSVCILICLSVYQVFKFYAHPSGYPSTLSA